MGVPEPPDPVKLVVAVLWNDPGALETATHRLRELWGPVDFAGSDFLFDVTGYYQAEMGDALMRRLLAFEKLVAPESLRAAKLRTNQIETALARDASRRVNLDVGYLDHSKIVLASAKYAGQKIHLGDGIWADLICRYKAGRYQPFEWTFPDFRDGRYDADLAAIRRIYLTQLRMLRKNRNDA